MQTEVPGEELKVCLKEIPKSLIMQMRISYWGLTYYKRNLFDEAKERENTKWRLGLTLRRQRGVFLTSRCLCQDTNTHDKASEMYKKAIEISPGYEKSTF